jgi:LDH2 family malate/lactate/ureidoglycolate dehydrogenase
LYRSTGTPLPDDVASDSTGAATNDPHLAEMLAPLGGAFGFKGAGLGGVAELFSAVMTGAGLSPDLAAMGGPDYATPRGLGAFVIVLDPDAFAGADLVRAGITRYLSLLRASPARPGMTVMAPGDREWAVSTRRSAEGVLLDPVTATAFAALAERLNIAPVGG